MTTWQFGHTGRRSRTGSTIDRAPRNARPAPAPVARFSKHRAIGYGPLGRGGVGALRLFEPQIEAGGRPGSSSKWSRTIGSKQLVLNSLGRLTGVSRIEAVFRAHVGDERKVLAASDQTDNGGRHSVAAHLCFDDIGLSAIICGVGTSERLRSRSS